MELDFKDFVLRVQPSNRYLLGERRCKIVEGSPRMVAAFLCGYEEVTEVV